MRPALIVAASLLLAACAPQADPPDPPSPQDDPTAASVAVDSAEGEVVLHLTVEPDEVSREQPVELGIRNEGDVEVGVGRRYHVERWDGEAWRELPWPEGHGWTDDLPLLAPGDTLALGSWPPDGAAFDEVGWHRAAVVTHVDVLDDPSSGEEVELHARFLVTD